MKDLDITITPREFFQVVQGKELHGLKFLKLITLDQPGEILSFFHRMYYFDWNGMRVCSTISTVHWETGDIHTSFVHACGEPSEIGPRFAEASKESGE